MMDKFIGFLEEHETLHFNLAVIFASVVIVGGVVLFLSSYFPQFLDFDVPMWMHTSLKYLVAFSTFCLGALIKIAYLMDENSAQG